MNRFIVSFAKNSRLVLGPDARLAFGLVMIAGVSAVPCQADDPADELVPENAAIITVDAPANTRIQANGSDQGTNLLLELRPLERGRIYRYQLTFTFPGGEKSERVVLVSGGQSVAVVASPPAAKHPECCAQVGHNHAPRAASFSPDGRLLATGSGPEVIIWDTATRRPLRTLNADPTSVVAVAFSPDGRTLLTAGDSGAVLWNHAAGESLRNFGDFRGYGSACMAFSPDGRSVLLTGSVWTGDHSNNFIYLNDVSTGNRLRTFEGHTDLIRCVMFNSDGTQVLSGSKDGSAILWDLASATARRTFRAGTGEVERALFAAGGRKIVATFRVRQGGMNDTGEIVVWNAETGSVLSRSRTATPVSDATTGMDGNPLFISGAWKDVGLTQWDGESLKPVQRFGEGRTGNIAVRSWDGRTLFDGVGLWDAETARLLGTLGHRRANVSYAAALPDGKQILFGSDREVQIWDLSSSQSRVVYELPAVYKAVQKLALSADGSTVVLLVEAAKEAPLDLIVVDVRSSREIRRLSIETRGRPDLDIDANGAQALIHYRSTVGSSGPTSRETVAGSQENGVESLTTLWDLHSGLAVRRTPTWTAGQVGIWCNFLGQGQRILVETFEQITVVDTASGQALQSLWGMKSLEQFRNEVAARGGARRQRGIRCVARSPNGQWLVMFGHDDNWVHNVATGRNDMGRAHPFICLWDAQTGRLERYLEDPPIVENENTRPPDWIVLAADGRSMVEKLESGSLVHRDLTTGAILRTLPPAPWGWSFHSHGFFPDNRRVLIADGTGSLRILDLATGEDTLRLIPIGSSSDQSKGTKGWVAVTPEGLFDGSEEGRKAVGFRIGGGLNVVPVDRFMQDFYRPGLTSDAFRGRRSTPAVSLAHALPPKLRVLSPTSGPVEAPNAAIEVEAIDQGGGMSALAIYQNGSRLLASGETVVDGTRTSRTFRVGLIEGENRFRITASSGDGSWDAEPSEVKLTYEKPLGRSRLHVVAVGVDRYADTSLNLSYAALDAHAFAELFRRRGRSLYETVDVSEVLNDKATRSGVREAVRQAGAKTRPQDTLVVFLAGHGTMVGQRYYFIPHELRRAGDRMEDDIRKQGLPADELSDDLGAAKALKRLLIIDTCASGGALALAGRGRSGFAMRGAIERLSRTQGIFTIAASSATEEAKESKELGHGVLSYALLAGLKAVDGGPLEGQFVRPSGTEGVADVLEWFGFAAGQVPRITAKLYGAPQDVQTSGQGASFPILPVEDR